MADGKGKRDDADSARSSDRRHAARIATVVAIPVTVVAVFVAFNLVASFAEEAEQDQMSAPTNPVEVEAPEFTEDEFEVCRALVSVIPDTLGDLPQRGVKGDGGAAEVAAAWGDPAVVMVCGVDPVDVGETDPVYRLDATCWAAVESDDTTVWTTVDRAQPVQLTVPAEHDSPGQLATALSEHIDDKIQATDEDSVPTGCYQ